MALGARNGNSKPIKAGMAWDPMRYPPRSKRLRRKGGTKPEKMGDYSLLIAIEINPTGGLDCRIERSVSCKQIGGHLIGIIEVSQGRVGIARAGIHHTLGTRLDTLTYPRRDKLLNGQREVFGLLPRAKGKCCRRWYLYTDNRFSGVHEPCASMRCGIGA